MPSLNLTPTLSFEPRFRMFIIKGNAQFVQTVTFEPLINLKKKHYGSW